jgi:predicted Fe-S protein YdhL (DUF1289 family)
MKFLASLALVLLFAIPAEGQIFKRRAARCVGGNCRVVHHPVVHHQLVTATTQTARTARSTGECADERLAWQEADNLADQAILARIQSRNVQNDATQQVAAAKAALAAAEAALAEADAALTEATQNVLVTTQAAEDAYRAWRVCIIQ